jgi:hypothetical protein
MFHMFNLLPFLHMVICFKVIWGKRRVLQEKAQCMNVEQWGYLLSIGISVQTLRDAEFCAVTLFYKT